MKHYETCLNINQRLALGERVLLGEVFGNANGHGNRFQGGRPLHFPRIGIYTGEGASHSWLWFVEIFDRMGFNDLCFLSEEHITGGALKGLDVLAMSGGDTFGIAEALGREGALEVEAFIRRGGLYLGACAGAYLPMNSSKEHLRNFNYVAVKISNLTKLLPEAYTLKEKFCTPYGCSYVFHPVREAVGLKIHDSMPFSGAGSLLAPLYGGPPMIASDRSQVLATYADFTKKTTFLVDRIVAQDTVLGKAAVIREKLGAGHLYLFGPHFEHPHFPGANQLMAKAIYWDVRGETCPERRPDRKGITIKGKAQRNFLRDIKREISNSRIVSAGMENMRVRWRIGNKLYDPSKVGEFLEAIWRRIKPLETLNYLNISPGKDILLIQLGKETAALLRRIKRDVNEDLETRDTAKEVFRVLKKTCMIFLDAYFRTKMHHFDETIRTESNSVETALKVHWYPRGNTP